MSIKAHRFYHSVLYTCGMVVQGVLQCSRTLGFSENVKERLFHVMQQAYELIFGKQQLFDPLHQHPSITPSLKASIHSHLPSALHLGHIYLPIINIRSPIDRSLTSNHAECHRPGLGKVQEVCRR